MAISFFRCCFLFSFGLLLFFCFRGKPVFIPFLVFVVYVPSFIGHIRVDKAGTFFILHWFGR